MRRAHALLVAACMGATLGTAAVAQEGPPMADICLAVSLGTLDATTVDAIAGSVGDALATRPVLIPAPSMAGSPGRDTELPERPYRLAIWTDAVDPVVGSSEADVGCGAAEMDDGTWMASISGEFLRAGTKRELAAAGTTPGFTSAIDVEWDEAADLVRTVLTFSGPLGIPNGTCWMDDVVSADGIGGSRVETTTGSETSPFGDGVCGRFEQRLENGGAGAQALVLLPRVIDLADGDVLRLGVDGVDVRDGAIHLWGGAEVASD